jgi:hypothetical protein
MGRFLSPDPSGLTYADITNPQSLNLYSYALNNPLVNTDPTGMECVWDDGSYDASDDAVTGNAEGCSGQGGTYVDPHLFENATLTNGQQSNTQPGDWSPNANPTIAQSWTNASATVNSGSIPQSGTFSDSSMTQYSFISALQQSGFSVSNLDTNLNKITNDHPGINMRESLPFCSIHLNIVPGTGVDGKPTSYSFHTDLFNPLKAVPTSAGDVPLLPFHAVADVAPDIAMKYHLTSKTGNQVCPQ